MNKRKLMLLIFIFFIIITINNKSFSEGLYDERIHWEPAKGTGMNISSYVYHDMNRNGIYDIGDRPLSKFAIKMTRPDGTTVIRRSNLNGFANFTNSYTSKNVDVYEPGEYTFELMVPKGWKVTSGNRIQKVNYTIGLTKRPGLVANNVPIPIGVVQEGKIVGRILNERFKFEELNDIKGYAISPTGIEYNLNIDKNGYFEIHGEYGEWTIIINDLLNDRKHIRKVKLGTVPTRISSIILNEYYEEKDKNKVELVDFEKITHSNIQKIPNGIAGIDWHNLLVTDFLLYKGEGYINNRMSGKYVGYNTSGQPVTLSNNDGFDFYGAYFGVAWLDSSEGETLEVKAWRNDKIVGVENIKLSALGPVYFAADYKNITKLEIKTKHYWQFVVDDILIGVN